MCRIFGHVQDVVVTSCAARYPGVGRFFEVGVQFLRVRILLFLGISLFWILRKFHQIVMFMLLVLRSPWTRLSGGCSIVCLVT